jgi:formyltetrahydrofolate hydrolase
MRTPVDDRQFLLTLTRPERAGIVHAVSRFVLGHGADIIDNRQFGDRRTGRSFMRMHFAAGPPRASTRCGPTSFAQAFAKQLSVRRARTGGVVHAGGASQPTPRDDPDRHPVA